MGIKKRSIAFTQALLIVLVASVLLVVPAAQAIGSQQNPQSSALGLEGTVPGAPPTQAATISIPTNGQVFTATPITVAGLCKSGLLVKVFSNNIFVGSVTCTNGSFSLKIDLFSGRNDLVARVYDSLDQQGPDSNTVTVTFNDALFAQFGSHVSLTSSYARIGANPGDALSWPFILSGGTGPYALSIDWGDGNPTDLKSISFPGVITMSHVYAQSGVYTIIAKATDANNTSAYLQVIGVANGKISGGVTTSGSSTPTTKTIILWQPLLALIPLVLIAFWLGSRHELYILRRSLENSREQQMQREPVV
jgi:hypothetical protein